VSKGSSFDALNDILPKNRNKSDTEDEIKKENTQAEANISQIGNYTGHYKDTGLFNKYGFPTPQHISSKIELVGIGDFMAILRDDVFKKPEKSEDESERAEEKTEKSKDETGKSEDDDVRTSKINETYVTKAQLQSIYTNTVVTDEMITDLNRVLGKYGITDVENIQHFIAQTCIETGYGDSILEKGSDSYLNRKKYGKKYSGVGYIQMTWDYSYAAFATYMILENNPDLKDVARYKNPKSNNRETIFKEYDKLVNETASRGYDINEYTAIVDDGRDYVANNFAWETAGYYWSTNGLTSVNSNTPVDDVTTIVNKWTDSYKTRIDAYDIVIKHIK